MGSKRVIITKPEVTLNDARWKVIEAANLLDSFFTDMIKNDTFSKEDMSDPELDFMDAVKELRKMERKSLKGNK